MELSTLESEKDQKRDFEVKLGEFSLVNLDKFYIDSFFVANHTAYELNIDFSFKSKDIQKIFYNAFIYNLCEYIKVNKKIVFFFDTGKKNKYYTYIVKKCKLMLPVCIYMQNLEFERVVERYNNGEVDVKSDIERMYQSLTDFRDTPFTFNRLSNFLKKNELVFLKSAYFTQHQIKLALMT